MTFEADPFWGFFAIKTQCIAFLVPFFQIVSYFIDIRIIGNTKGGVTS